MRSVQHLCRRRRDPGRARLPVHGRHGLRHDDAAHGARSISRAISASTASSCRRPTKACRSTSATRVGRTPSSSGPDEAELSGLLSGFGGASVAIDESIKVDEYFAELRVPLVQDKTRCRGSQHRLRVPQLRLFDQRVSVTPRSSRSSTRRCDSVRLRASYEQRDPRAEHHRALQPAISSARSRSATTRALRRSDGAIQRRSGRRIPCRNVCEPCGPIRLRRSRPAYGNGGTTNQIPQGTASQLSQLQGGNVDPAAGGGGYLQHRRVAHARALDRDSRRASTTGTSRSTTSIDTSAGRRHPQRLPRHRRSGVLQSAVPPAHDVFAARRERRRAAATSCRPAKTSPAARPAASTCRQLTLRLRTPRLAPARAGRLLHAEQRDHAVPRRAYLRLHRALRAHLPDSQPGVATRLARATWQLPKGLSATLGWRHISEVKQDNNDRGPDAE